MTVPVKRVPPPPPIAEKDPMFNRWLHDLTAFIAEGGGIDIGTIPGYDVLLSTVATHTIQIASHTIDIASLTSQVGVNTSNIATNTTNIASLTSQVGLNTSNITSNTANIATNTANITANTMDITALIARSQVRNGTAAPAAGLGTNGDWFADTAAKHIYVKTAGAWVLIV